MLAPEGILYRDGGGGEVRALHVQMYPDGTPMVKDDGQPWKILCRTRYIPRFMAMLWWVDALREQGLSKDLQLILPSVPGARQDRLMPPGGDQLFTIKSIAREINLRGFDSVVVLDPHSEATAALIERCRVVSAAQIVQLCPLTDVGNYDIVIAPDGGAGKRASAVAQVLGIPMVQAWKKRDTKTGALTGFGCEPLGIGPGGRALLVDDICDGGGTFVGLAHYLKTGLEPHGLMPRLDLYTTHGYYTKGVLELQQYFERLISTDSVIKDYPLETLPRLDVCERLL